MLGSSPSMTKVTIFKFRDYKTRPYRPGFVFSDRHIYTRLKIRVALVPPKPKLLDITASSFFS